MIGNSGCGKSTLSRQLAQAIRAPHHELDELYWGPDWTATPREGFRRTVGELVREESWVVDGNYADLARDLIWARADLVVWLDYSFLLCAWNIIRRTISRRGQLLWNGNRETWRDTIFSSDSLLAFAARTHLSRRKQNLEDMLNHPKVRGLRFCHPSETQEWMNTAWAR